MCGAGGTTLTSHLIPAGLMICGDFFTGGDGLVDDLGTYETVILIGTVFQGELNPELALAIFLPVIFFFRRFK